MPFSTILNHFRSNELLLGLGLFCMRPSKRWPRLNPPSRSPYVPLTGTHFGLALCYNASDLLLVQLMLAFLSMMMLLKSPDVNWSSTFFWHSLQIKSMEDLGNLGYVMPYELPSLFWEPEVKQSSLLFGLTTGVQSGLANRFLSALYLMLWCCSWWAQLGLGRLLLQKFGLNMLLTILLWNILWPFDCIVCCAGNW